MVRDGARTRRYVSAERARAAFERAVAARRADGYVEAPDVVGDREARAVHADELIDRGDPRGELIALGDALARAPDEATRAPLARALADHLDTHHDEIYGALAAATLRAGRAPTGGTTLAVTWEAGVAHAATLQAAPGRPLDATYRALVELPIARTLRRLAFGAPGPSPYGPSYGELVRTLLAAGTPPHLEALAFGDVALGELGAPAARVTVGDVRPLIAALPALRELAIAVGQVTFGPFTAPALERLALAWCEPIELVRSTAPRLAHLELAHAPRAGAFLALLARTPLLAQLRVLRLVRCGLGDADLDTLAMHAPRFRAVRTIHLHGDRLTPARVRDTAEDLPGLVVD